MGTRHVDWVPPERFDEYRLIKALGRGSMGQVWLAHDTLLDRQVAVKFVSELPDHEAVRQRFLTEARAAARVQHPNIIAIYRVGEIGARPYLISEYVRGDSLDRIARPVAWP
ncbi:MAG TPA: protein kinase, partial [Kofleriaceae bacterium]|nr:protein kinase [Kofleriaceae bacterium]